MLYINLGTNRLGYYLLFTLFTPTRHPPVLPSPACRTVNQHVPQYCGSCWAQGPSSALADRFIIADPKRFANLALSPQVVLNCRAGGSCEGGNPGVVWEFAHKVGVREKD